MNKLEQNSALRNAIDLGRELHDEIEKRILATTTTAEQLPLLRAQAWHYFKVGVLVGVLCAGITIMVALIVAQGIYV